MDAELISGNFEKSSAFTGSICELAIADPVNIVAKAAAIDTRFIICWSPEKEFTVTDVSLNLPKSSYDGHGLTCHVQFTGTGMLQSDEKATQVSSLHIKPYKSVIFSCVVKIAVHCFESARHVPWHSRRPVIFQARQIARGSSNENIDIASFNLRERGA
tara:strand:+ start:48680 stop:49156 length:477 start_codon:yes stop_codon:yes gene_type:complete